MSITIKVLTEHDAPAYRELRLHSFRESALAFSESYEDEVQKSVGDFYEEIKPEGDPPEKFTLGAFAEDGAMAGIITFKRDKRTKGRHKSMIHAMYTHPDYRLQGIGHQLLQETVKMAHALPALEQIHLWVLHSTTSASQFYLKAGFQSQGTCVKNDLKIGDTYVDAEYMVLYL